MGFAPVVCAAGDRRLKPALATGPEQRERALLLSRVVVLSDENDGAKNEKPS